MNEENNKENKERFCNILTATARENMDYVLEDLQDMGFFDAPASSAGHYSYPGGLVAHSLNVYDAAMAIRSTAIAMRPDIEAQLPEDSVAIAALLQPAQSGIENSAQFSEPGIPWGFRKRLF